jgi:hypothetical protein
LSDGRIRGSLQARGAGTLNFKIPYTFEGRAGNYVPNFLTATDLWVAAVNNWTGAGRWAFLEVTDPGTPST